MVYKLYFGSTIFYDFGSQCSISHGATVIPELVVVDNLDIYSSRFLAI